MEERNGTIENAASGWRLMDDKALDEIKRNGTEIVAHVCMNETRVVYWNGAGWIAPGLGEIFPHLWVPLPALPPSEVK